MINIFIRCQAFSFERIKRIYRIANNFFILLILFILFRVNLDALENDIIHLLGRYRPLGCQFFDTGLKGIEIMKWMGAFHNFEFRIFFANGFHKFLGKRADLDQAGCQVQGLDAVFLKRFDFCKWKIVGKAKPA